MGFQMRNKTLISWIVVAATAALAGSSNATVTSTVSAFTTNYGFSGSVFANPGRSYVVSGGMATDAYNWGFSTFAPAIFGIYSGGGSLSFSATPITAYPAGAYLEVDFSRLGGFSLAGFEKFSIDTGATSGAGTSQLQISVTNDAGSGTWQSVLTTLSTDGTYDILANSFAANASNNAGATLDWSYVRSIDLVVILSTVAPYVTFSNFTATYVPAPGALALLGAAGLVGARHRRA